MRRWFKLPERGKKGSKQNIKRVLYYGLAQKIKYKSEKGFYGLIDIDDLKPLRNCGSRSTAELEG